MKKILFIQPTIYDDSGRLIKKRKLYFVGLTFPLLAALTPAGWDMDICIETIENIPFDSDADIICLGSMGHSIRRSFEIAAEFKRRRKIVLMGGPMASLVPKETKEFCDAVIIGDAENVWPHVLEDIINNKLQPFYQQKLTRLSTPLPRYDLILGKNIGDFLPVQAGRGCLHSCNFCSIYCLYRNQYLQRDIPEVIRDIRHVKSLGFKKFLLLDDNIVSAPDYFEELCREIKKLDMKWMSQCAIDIAKNDRLLRSVAASGCITLSFGLESINKVSLEKLNKSWCNPDDYGKLLKKINDAGIDVSTEMIIGADGDTRESIRDTANFIEKNKIVIPKFYILTPIPGTDFYKKVVNEKRLCDYDVIDYSPSKAVMHPKNMTPEELTEEFWRLYNKVYSIKSILGRTLFHRRTLKSPGRYLFYFFVNLYYRHQIKRKIAPIIV